MVDEFAAIERIKRFILDNKKPAYFTTNRKEMRVRCPYCGDSKNDKNHAHLYIQMKPPFKFYCQKCNTGGVLNAKTMRDFQLYDTEIAVSLSELSKEVAARKGYSTTSFKKQDFKFPIVDTELSRKTVNYFNNRYNSNFTNEEIVTLFKGITDPVEFFKENHLRIQPGQYDISNAIGFMSTDNSHIIFRDISGMQPKRYYNFSIFPEMDWETNKFYSIKTSIDMMIPEIDLIMTEGIFDILGVYNSFYKGQTENKIFVAACGKGFNSVISNFIHKGLLNLNITIYSDSDVNVDFYRNMKMSSPYLKRIPITIYYNTIGKDYGVPREEIQLRKILI